MANITADPNFKPPSWWLQGEPVMAPTFDFLLRSFHELSTERSIGWQCGPIPVSKIREDGQDRLGLDETVIEPYTAIIRYLDAAFLEYSEAQRNKEQERNKRAADGRLPNQGRRRHFGRREGR